MTTLLAPPFNLITGSSVYVQVVSYNAVGNSQNSTLGNGAVVFLSTPPGPPTDIE